MLPAYRLTYPDNPHALPQLWEWAQPHIHHLIRNARTFERRVVQRYFSTWNALARENARIWAVHYRPSVLYQPWKTWDAWLEEYRTLVSEVQQIYEESALVRCQARGRHDPARAPWPLPETDMSRIDHPTT